MGSDFGAAAGGGGIETVALAGSGFAGATSLVCPPNPLGASLGGSDVWEGVTGMDSPLGMAILDVIGSGLEGSTMVEMMGLTGSGVVGERISKGFTTVLAVSTVGVRGGEGGGEGVTDALADSGALMGSGLARGGDGVEEDTGEVTLTKGLAAATTDSGFFSSFTTGGGDGLVEAAAATLVTVSTMGALMVSTTFGTGIKSSALGAGGLTSVFFFSSSSRLGGGGGGGLLMGGVSTLLLTFEGALRSRVEEEEEEEEEE